MAKQSTEIKNLVESAIRVSDDSLPNRETVWSPMDGADWTAGNGARVIIQPPTRFCIKASYRVIHPLFGVWVGYLNGSLGRRIGAPRLYMTAEQLKAA